MSVFAFKHFSNVLGPINLYTYPFHFKTLKKCRKCEFNDCKIEINCLSTSFD